MIELALKQVNNRTDVLPGYQLNMVLNDTKVCTKESVKAFMMELSSVNFASLRVIFDNLGMPWQLPFGNSLNNSRRLLFSF